MGFVILFIQQPLCLDLINTFLCCELFYNHNFHFSWCLVWKELDLRLIYFQELLFHFVDVCEWFNLTYISPDLGINPESEFYTKVVCCGNWKLRNCWINAAKGKCNSSDIEQLSKIIYTRHPNLDEECWQYPDDLSNCGYPKYVVVIISLIVTVAVVAIVVGLIVFYYRWQRRVASVDIHKPSYLNNDEIREVEIKVGTEV